AAYCIKVIGGTDEATAAKSVTDRFHDRGIDAIYHDQSTSQLLLVQSKWSDGIKWNDAGEFADGVRKLITANWQSFSANKKIFDRRNELDIALRSAAKILLITVHHGPNPADKGVLKRISDLAEEIDGGSGLANARHWHQSHLLD
ncbi:MAG TPA: hypothetical protein PK867_23640, partial [Pirellulales bacterium]|nr:hypothetical protein [Pirellulales bacterium]